VVVERGVEEGAPGETLQGEVGEKGSIAGRFSRSAEMALM